MRGEMGLIDENFRRHPVKYVLQCGLAGLTMAAVLLFLDALSHTAIVASLGASFFIAFTMPKTQASKPRPLIGGYLIGMSTGSLCSMLADICTFMGGSYILFGALAVGVAIFLMVVTNTEHAPAAGIALGLVINEWDGWTLLFILGAVVFLTVVKRLLRSVLINLI